MSGQNVLSGGRVRSDTGRTKPPSKGFVRCPVRVQEGKPDKRLLSGPASLSEDAIAWQLRASGAPQPEREYRFASPRRWRFDFAWPDLRLALEVEGGTWVGGRHVRPAAFEGDCEKYNAATLLGWAVLRVTPAMVDDGRALAAVERYLEART